VLHQGFHSSTALSATVWYVHNISEHNYLDYSTTAKKVTKTIWQESFSHFKGIVHFEINF